MGTNYGTPRTIPGLAGKFFNGSWRSIIDTGNIGTLPLTPDNDSSNVTGSGGMPSADHRYGVNLWEYIDYGNSLGSSYGFIAIGYFIPPTTGTYTFYTASDDGSGVWIGNVALPGAIRSKANAVLDNNLTGGQGTTKRSGSITLNEIKMYPIRIVHEEIGGGDDLRFTWSGPGISETEDLSQHFRTPLNNNKQLAGNYFFYEYNS